MSDLPKPTDAELAILRVIWTDGPSTVRHITTVLNQVRPTMYTTVLKLLQIMTVKGLVLREVQGRSHVYAAARSSQRTQRQLLRDLLERAFGGSASDLVMQALATTRATPEEMRQVERLLAKRRKDRARDE